MKSLKPENYPHYFLLNIKNLMSHSFRLKLLIILYYDWKGTAAPIESKLDDQHIHLYICTGKIKMCAWAVFEKLILHFLA